MMKLSRILLPLALFIQTDLQAQFEGSIYRTDGTYLSSVKLTVDGVEKKLAWCGGVNNPQCTVPDLNHDGLTDLVIFEPYFMVEERGIKTFINKGSTGNPNYMYAPEFEYLFPTAQKYIKMEDYNCDGAPDLFHNGFAGLAICDGYYNSNNSLAFRNCRDIKYYYPTHTIPSPVSLAGSDLPSIVDVDKDGDLDFIAFSPFGTLMYWYKNIVKEKGFKCDTFAVQLRDVCWGKVYQPGPREHTLHYSCDNSLYENQPKITDGANTVCLLDHDGDGDYDVLNGNSQYSDMQFLRNNKVQFGNGIDSMTWQDTTWQSGGKKVNMPSHPLATWIDIDADGDRDVLVSPIALNTENYKSIQLYKNLGSDASPDFAFQTDTLFIDRMLDLGSHSYPVFYDYDKDGKQDLFVGSRGFFQPNGQFKSTIWYLRNTSSGTNISLNVEEKNFLRVDTVSIEGASLAIGDLDNDGLDDLIVGHLNGKMTYYRNYAASAAVQPDWRLTQRELRDVNATEIDAGSFAAPLIYDIDGDSKKDLIICNEAGFLQYYKNTGVVGQMALQFVTDKLGGVQVEPEVLGAGKSAPFIGKMDNTGKAYLVVGGGYGRIFRYDGFQNGNTTTPYTLIDTQYSGIRAAGKFLAPAIADLNGDGKYEMMIGSDKGGLFLYRQVWNVNVKDVANEMELMVYPNPAQGLLTIETNETLANADLRIYNMVGQLVHEAELSPGSNVVSIDITNLKPGVYVCSVRNHGSVKLARFSKLN